MTRASLILEELNTELLFEACIHEAMTIPQTKKLLDDIKSRAKAVTPQFKTGLRKEGGDYKAQLDEETSDHPELKAAINKDLAKFKDKSEELGKKVKGKVSKMKKPTRRMGEAWIREEIDAAFTEAEFNEATMASLSALRTLSTSKETGWINRILWLFLAYAGTMLIASLHTALITALAAIIGPYALPVTAVIVAPITEEWFKKLTIYASGGSQTPAFVFTITEFFLYVSQAMVAASMMANPVMGIAGGAYLAVALIGRIYAMEMHMTTTKMYAADYKKFGYIKNDTFTKGIAIHRLWNAGAILFSVLAAAVGAALMLNPLVTVPLLSLAAGVALTSLFQKSLKNEKERVNHAIKGQRVPAYA